MANIVETKGTELVATLRQYLENRPDIARILADYATKVYVDSKMQEGFKVLVVEELPAVGEENTLYLIESALTEQLFKNELKRKITVGEIFDYQENPFLTPVDRKKVVITVNFTEFGSNYNYGRFLQVRDSDDTVLLDVGFDDKVIEEEVQYYTFNLYNDPTATSTTDNIKTIFYRKEITAPGEPPHLKQMTFTFEKGETNWTLTIDAEATDFIPYVINNLTIKDIDELEIFAGDIDGSTPLVSMTSVFITAPSMNYTNSSLAYDQYYYVDDLWRKINGQSSSSEVEEQYLPLTGGSLDGDLQVWGDLFVSEETNLNDVNIDGHTTVTGGIFSVAGTDVNITQGKLTVLDDEEDSIDIETDTIKANRYLDGDGNPLKGVEFTLVETLPVVGDETTVYLTREKEKVVLGKADFSALTSPTTIITPFVNIDNLTEKYSYTVDLLSVETGSEGREFSPDTSARITFEDTLNDEAADFDIVLTTVDDSGTLYWAVNGIQTTVAYGVEDDGGIRLQPNKIKLEVIPNVTETTNITYNVYQIFEDRTDYFEEVIQTGTFGATTLAENKAFNTAYNSITLTSITTEDGYLYKDIVLVAPPEALESNISNITYQPYYYVDEAWRKAGGDGGKVVWEQLGD